MDKEEWIPRKRNREGVRQKKEDRRRRMKNIAKNKERRGRS